MWLLPGNGRVEPRRHANTRPVSKPPSLIDTVPFLLLSLLPVLLTLFRCENMALGFQDISLVYLCFSHHTDAPSFTRLAEIASKVFMNHQFEQPIIFMAFVLKSKCHLYFFPAVFTPVPEQEELEHPPNTQIH